MHRARIGILVGPKGRGSNMMSIIRACQAGRILAEVATVVSPVEGTPAVEDARTAGIQVTIAPPEPLDSYGERLRAALEGSDWVCLAGFTRLLPAEVLDRFEGHVLNIHPALLPRHGGKGMYGARVHEAVLASGDKESGCTVHVVTERYDEGAIIHQRRVPVLPADTPDTLAARVLEQERIAYPEALAMVLGA